MGHGPLPRDGDWWACDYPERPSHGYRVAYDALHCRSCLFAVVAGNVAEPSVPIRLGAESAEAFGLAEGAYYDWEELLPLLAEYHHLPLRTLIPQETNR